MEPKSDTDQDIGRKGSVMDQFHDLMKHRVTKILLVSSLYEAFTLEEDGLLFERISSEFEDVSLMSPPRVHRVSSARDALEKIGSIRYDLVITMARLPDMDPLLFGRSVKECQPDLPVVLLLTERADISRYHKPGVYGSIDKVFLWDGDSALFLAITKLVEDMKNAIDDTRNDFVKVILIVEDSPKYLSVFLPLIYTEIMRQNKILMREGYNEQERILRKRSRPKIITAETYEEAMQKYYTFKDHLLCLISDIAYPKGGIVNESAGFDLVKDLSPIVPVLLASSNVDHREMAGKMGASFLDKNSPTLLSEVREFFKLHLGFGDFIFRMPDGKEFARAKGIKEFIELVKDTPSESLYYHGQANHFSAWLMARGEVELARKLRPKKVSDFKNGEEMRSYLIDSIREVRRSRQLGTITEFDSQRFEFGGTMTRLGGGSFGGKGRGVAFLSSLINKNMLWNRYDGCRIVMPDTLLIGTDWYDRFMEMNDLKGAVKDAPDREISRSFLSMKFPQELRTSLERYISHMKDPIAVRSSSLLEDSLNQPFAGIYSTYMLPNNDKDDGRRLDQLIDAIKMVYASTFHRSARSYLRSTIHMTEKEKMAVVIQRVVGRSYGEIYYPMLSGVAQSLNYYPMAPLKRDEGFASIALGLGKMVVEGEKVLSFSPFHPDIVPGFFTPEETLQNSQDRFYAVNMRSTACDLSQGDEVTLIRSDIKGMDPSLEEYIVSTYDVNDNRLRDGPGSDGPKLITFAGILKYGMVPLSEIIMDIIRIGAEGFGRPVEIEFAMSVADDGVMEFFPLQIRPLVSSRERSAVEITDEEVASSIIMSDVTLGNGSFSELRDIVYVPMETFDSNRTPEIAMEVGEMNRSLCGRPYLLIGPGRWGTRDRFLGIPVSWDQISCCRAMVEYSSDIYRIDPSHGTHFFHNITSMDMPYFTVSGKGSSIDWDAIGSMEMVRNGPFVRHVRSDRDLTIKVDGRTGKGIVR